MDVSGTIKQAFADKIVDVLIGGVVLVFTTLFHFLFQAQWYYVLSFAIGILIISISIALLIKRALKKPLKTTTEIQGDKNQITFYPCRSDSGLKVLKKFLNKYDALYALFGTGEILESYNLYDPKHFRCLILLDPYGEHIKSNSLSGYYTRDASVIKTKIINVTKHAQSYGIDVRWWDGCLPFSLILGSPYSETNGGVLLEVHIPYKEGHERPSLIFDQQTYPDFFRVLKESYEKLLNGTREADKI